MAAEVRCWDCGHPIDGADRYCRYCGTGQGAFVPWYYSPLGIGLMTVFALGPFSVPLIWRSPKLSMRGRWIATALTLAYTFYLIERVMAMVRMVQGALSGVIQ